MSAALLREPSDGVYFASLSSDIDCIGASLNTGAKTSRPARRIYIGTAGSLNLVSTGGSTVFLYNVPAGSFVDLETKTVLQSGTTALNITVLF